MLEPEGLGCDEDGPVGPLVPEPDEPEPLEPVVPLGVVVVVVPVVVGAHEAETLATGPTPAGTIWAGGVPEGALTLKLSVWPVTSVTVTVHWSAEAVGKAAIPMIANTDATVTAAVFSFRRIDNLT